jgi:hypothetical protein
MERLGRQITYMKWKWLEKKERRRKSPKLHFID